MEIAPLKPPVEGHVLRVARWPDVFETAHSRKNKVLTWISIPINFNSTGYQKLLDHFDGMEAAALYGAWNALCQLAAQPKEKSLRGKLCGHKGEVYNTRRIARITGLPVEAFERLIPWALEVGWLQWAAVDEPWELTAEDDDSDSIPKVRIDDSEIRTLPNPTQPNLTQQNPTQPTREGEDDWLEVRQGLEQAGVKAAASAVSKAKRRHWTATHALAVLSHYRSKPGAWNPATLYGRFDAEVSVPDDGWPDESAEWKAAANSAARARLDQADAEKRRQELAVKQRERETEGSVDMSHHIRKLAEASEARKRQHANN